MPVGESRLMISEEIRQQLLDSNEAVAVEDAYIVRLKGLTGEHKIYRLRNRDEASE